MEAVDQLLGLTRSIWLSVSDFEGRYILSGTFLDDLSGSIAAMTLPPIIQVNGIQKSLQCYRDVDSPFSDAKA